jgi:diguanylate cyclase (GGDEF)-like protein/PAS domain S-box-containing protein
MTLRIPGGYAGPELHLVKSAGAYAAQSANVLAGILESADELFAAFDADFRFIVFNAAFRREFTEVFGHPPALGQSLQEALAGYAEQQEVIELMRRAFGGEAFKIDREFAGHGNQQKAYQITLTPVLNPEGQAVVVALVAHDITAQSDAERKFQQLLEASPDAMLITRAGVIEYINTQAATLFGYAPGALVGQPLEVLVPRHLHQRHIRERTDYENFPQTRPMGKGRDLRGVRADGTEFPVEISLSPLTVAGQTMVAAAIRDISQRKKAEDQWRQQNAQLAALLAAREAELAQAHQQIDAGREREQALTLAMAQFEAVFEHADTGIAIIRPDGHFMNVNPCLSSITGYPREQLLQIRLHDMTHPDDVATDNQLDARLLAGAIGSYAIDKRLYRQDGTLIWVMLAVSVKRDDNGVPQYFVVVLRDITQRKLIEQKLGEAQMRLQLAAEIAQLGFWEWEPETNATYFSPEWKQQLGYADQELPATYEEWKSRLHPEDAERILQALQDFVARPRGECRVEYRLRHRDGRYRWFLSRMIALEDLSGKAKKVIGIRLDITERKEAEQHIREAGQHDPLTGLPNRALLYEYAGHLLAAARRHQTQGALLFVDLDRFKDINDTHGHEVGDAVLREVAQRLSSAIRKGDIAGRLGGDEFLVILPQVADAAIAAAVAEHLLARLNPPQRIGEITLVITPSIGVAMFPDSCDDPDTLVRNADQAMYMAKERGRNRVQFFTPELARRVDDAQVLESRIKVALQQNEFALHYQAIASAETAQPIGAEALLRWQPRSGQSVPPREAIPIAETTGLIGELGEWIVRSAIEQQQQWQRAGLPALRIAVNISPAQFRHKDFAVTLGRLIRVSGIDPAWVQIELAESTVMQDLEKAIAVCNDIHQLGARIALDNFGSGHCGLDALCRLPVDTLKIDTAFMRLLEQEPRSERVIHAVIALGHELNFEIAVGGIESEELLVHMRAHQCDLVQGFEVGKPMPAQEFQRWYRGQGR